MSPASAFVVPLRGAGAPPAEVGGKAAWLDRLVAAGFVVPKAVAITTDAYRFAVAEPGLATFLAELRTAAVDDPHHTDHGVDEAFLGTPLPEVLLEAVSQAASLVRSTSDEALAARSSATAEDLASTSFAGQYRSLLDLSGVADLERAVRLVWASLWHRAPRAYRRFHGVDESRLAMAVIVMPMVAAERAGVAFTVDPGGAPGMVRVETVHGLGEGLVSGRVTPTVSLVPRDESAPGRSHLDDPLAVEVCDLALAVERAFGAPQDVEWAWDGRSVVLLQARPITTGHDRDDDGFDSRVAPGERWTTAGITEMLPGVLPPLRWETSGFLVEEAYRAWFAQLDPISPATDGRRLLGRFRGRAALDLDLLEGLLGGAPEDLEQQYFGGGATAPTPPAPARPSGRWRGARHDLLVLRARRHAIAESSIVGIAIDDLLEAPTSLPQDGDALLVHRRRLLDLAGRAIAVEAALAACAVDAYERLRRRLVDKLGQPVGERRAQQLTARVGRVVGPLTAIGPAVAEARDDADVRDVIDDSERWSDAYVHLAKSTTGRRLSLALPEAARRAGSAAVFGGPTWAEDLDGVWAVARRAEAAPADVAVGVDQEVWEEVAAELRALPGWRTTRWLTGQLIDVRLSNLHRLAEDAIDLLERRERAKGSVLALGGEVRRVHLALGRQLVEHGRLEEAADVELVGERELAQLVEGGGPSLAELARRRRWLARVGAERPLPLQFVGRPSGQPEPVPEGDVFEGWGAGPGRYEGRARVLHAPDPRALERGDVLVATTTDASWSPLFLHAGAIIVEQGGPLSHAAIVARELGIPAVLNVPGMVARLEHVDRRVSVDGDEGVVVVLPVAPEVDGTHPGGGS